LSITVDDLLAFAVAEIGCFAGIGWGYQPVGAGVDAEAHGPTQALQVERQVVV
jgi:hypothetical protein